MARTISVSEVHTGADADALGGTKLESMPGRGVLVVWAASTVSTATITVKTPRAIVSEGEPLPLRANGVPAAGDRPWILPVGKGEKPDIELGGTTGTIQLRVQYVGS